MTDIDEVEEACNKLLRWHRTEKLPIYGYEHHVAHGKTYLAKLLNMKVIDDKDESYSSKWLTEYNEAGHRLIEEINGPHGYAMLQAAIVKYKILERRAHKRYMRNKKARITALYQIRLELQKEEHNAGLQINSGTGRLLP